MKPTFVLLFCLVTILLTSAPQKAEADRLDCDSVYARDKQVHALGKLEGHELSLITCTSGHEWSIGRSYFRWTDKQGHKQAQEIAGATGCGLGATTAIRKDNEVLFTFRTCQTREYYPPPKWVVRVYVWQSQKGAFKVRRYSESIQGKQRRKTKNKK